MNARVFDVNVVARSIAEAFIQRSTNHSLHPERMPDLNKDKRFAWLAGRKWFDVPRLAAQAIQEFHHLEHVEWEDIVAFLARSVSQTTYYNEEGLIVTCPFGHDRFEVAWA